MPMNSEDRQPNESISRRRGTVPIVRSARTTGGPYRGFGRPDFTLRKKPKWSTALPGGLNHQFGAANGGDAPPNLSLRKHKFRRNCIEITVELPLHCRSGSHKSRRDWLSSKKRTIQNERGVRVVGHEISGFVAYFYCQVLETIYPTLDHVHDAGTSLSEMAAVDAPAATEQSVVAKQRSCKDRGLPQLTTSAPSVFRTQSSPNYPPQTTSSLSPHSMNRSLYDRNLLISHYHEPQQKFRSGKLSIPATSLSHSPAASIQTSQATAKSMSLSPLTHLSRPTHGSHTADTENLSPKQSLRNTLFTECSSDTAECQNNTGYSTHSSTSNASDSFEGALSTVAASKSPLSSPISPLRWEVHGEITRIPTQPHDRPRRILISPTRSSIILNISMHGFIDGADISPLRHRHVVRSLNPAREFVDDACLVTVFDRSVVILGHARENQQLSLVGLSGNDIGTCIPYNRPRLPDKKSGVSAVTAMMQPLMFASGGYDHVVHLWELKADLSSASPRTLAMKHTSVVQSLLPIRDTSHKLVSTGADCIVHFWDLSSERVVNTIKTSNSVYHAHKASSPFCTLLEVANREFQFEVRDHRFVPTNPAQRFGYLSPEIHGRFIKGDAMSELFACGDRDGTIRLWDLRNTNEPCSIVSCFPGQKVIQVTFCQYGLVACSKDNQVALITHEKTC